MRATGDELIPFELTVGECIWVHELGPDEVLARTDLVEHRGASSPERWVLQATAFWAGTERRRWNARAFRICDTGDVCLRVTCIVQQHYGVNYSYGVERL